MLFTKSKLWTTVEGMEAALAASNIIGLRASKLKDSKVCFDIVLHCGEKKIITLCPLKTSKEICERLKQLYQKLNKANQSSSPQKFMPYDNDSHFSIS